MPSNQQFSVNILVGNVEVPEYKKDGQTYVESNLCTPLSYKLAESEFVSGELEKQEWPVTPYRIQIKTNPDLPEAYYFRILVDGTKVKAISLGSDSVGVIKGFRDGSVVREFLFSMPRFAKDFDDRLEAGRESDVGCIEVECWQARLRSSCWRPRHKPLKFLQANKKDVTRVTNGEYTMATSKVGKPVSHRAVLRKVDSWKRTELISSLKVNYRMGHTLQEMGLTLRPCIFPPPSETVPSTSGKREATVKTENTQNDVIKIDDDDFPRVVQGVVDLTGDSDEEMNSFSDTNADIPGKEDSEVLRLSNGQPTVTSGGERGVERINVDTVVGNPQSQSTSYDHQSEVTSKSPNRHQGETSGLQNRDDELSVKHQDSRSSSSAVENVDMRPSENEPSETTDGECGEKSPTTPQASSPLQCGETHIDSVGEKEIPANAADAATVSENDKNPDTLEKDQGSEMELAASPPVIESAVCDHVTKTVPGEDSRAVVENDLELMETNGDKELDEKIDDDKQPDGKIDDDRPLAAKVDDDKQMDDTIDGDKQMDEKNDDDKQMDEKIDGDKQMDEKNDDDKLLDEEIDDDKQMDEKIDGDKQMDEKNDDDKQMDDDRPLDAKIDDDKLLDEEIDDDKPMHEKINDDK